MPVFAQRASVGVGAGLPFGFHFAVGRVDHPDFAGAFVAEVQFPFGRIDAAPAVVGTIAIGIFSVPVFFAGILFSSEFRITASPSSALCSNVLGAVAGGLLENLSLAFGLRSLLLVAIALYCVAGVGWWRGKYPPRQNSSGQLPKALNQVAWGDR